MKNIKFNGLNKLITNSIRYLHLQSGCSKRVHSSFFSGFRICVLIVIVASRFSDIALPEVCYF